jgi:tetratricopeptide (TPR) repeat protein
MLPAAGLVIVGGLAIVAVSALVVSRDQSRVALLIETLVALSGAASSLAGLLLPRLWRRDRRGLAAGTVAGLPVAVPAGQLPSVIRGRSELMGHLRRSTRARASAPVILAGMGGAGKSTVAAAFAETQGRAGHARRRRYVWWVSAADVSSFTGGLVTVARQLGAAKADLEVIRAGGPDGPDRLWALLDGSGRRWVLVFDNADNPSVLASPPRVAPDASDEGRVRLPADGTGWVRQSRRGLLVVTTRDKDPATWGRASEILAVDPLPEEQAALVLLDCAPRAGGEPEARLLARHLGGLPLPLRLAGSNLSSAAARHQSFAGYLRALEDPDRRPRLLTDRPSVGHMTGSRSVVMRTWEMSLDDLGERGIPQARPLLRLLSCFAPATPIPHELLAAQQLGRLLAAAPEGAGPVEPALAEYRLEDGLHGLAALSLIDIRPFGGTRADQRAVVVHPVVAATNRAHLAQARDEDHLAALIVTTAIEMMSAALTSLDGGRAADWPDYLAFGPHLHALLSAAASDADRGHLTELVAITSDAVNAHTLSGAVQSGEHLAAAAASMTRRLGGEDPVILRARHMLAWCIAAQGRYQQAEAMFREVLAGLRTALGSDHRHTLNTHNELAWIAGCQHRWAEAETTYRHVLAERTRALGDTDRDTLITRHELGWVLANQGRTQEAAAILRDVLAARQELLGDDHPRTIMTRHELAWITARQGSIPEAEAAYRHVIQSCLEVLGHEHHHTMTTQHELAWVLALAGKRRAALAQYRSVLTTRTRALGASHRDTTDTRNALASLNNRTITTPYHIP